MPSVPYTMDIDYTIRHIDKRTAHIVCNLKQLCLPNNGDTTRAKHAYVAATRMRVSVDVNSRYSEGTIVFVVCCCFRSNRIHIHMQCYSPACKEEKSSIVNSCVCVCKSFRFIELERNGFFFERNLFFLFSFLFGTKFKPT